jgi:hypothetical protein
MSYVPTLYDYSNIFDSYTDEEGYSFYDLNNNLIIEGDVDPVLYDVIFYNEGTSFYELSYKFYGTVQLWWIILLANNIVNPFEDVKNGDKLKILKKEVVSQILSNINSLNG